MKKAKIIVGAIIIALVSFILGAYISYHFMGKFIDEVMRPFVSVDRFAMQVMEDYSTASLLYQSNDAKALESVNLRLDGKIIALDSVMSDSENERSIENATKTIKRVKALRDKYSYTNDDDKIQSKLTKIYNKYETKD